MIGRGYSDQFDSRHSKPRRKVAYIVTKFSKTGHQYEIVREQQWC